MERSAWIDGVMTRLAPIRQAYDEPALRQVVQAWLAIQFARRTDPAFADRFAGIAARTGAPADAFLHTVLDVAGAQVLAGVRFYAGDPDRPFVDVFAWTAPPDWTAVAAAAADHWRSFAPVEFRLVAAVPPEGVEARLDQSVHLARVSDMPLAKDPAVSLTATDNAADAADFVGQSYAEAVRMAPELDGEIHAADEATLAECRDTGTLHWIMADGDRAGLIATLLTEIEMLPGALIVEETVRADFRGRGLARTAQGLLAAEIAQSQPDQVLLGTIFANNPASRRTAEAAGRPAKLSYWFFSPATR